MRRISVSFGFCALACFIGWLNWRICLCFLTAAAVHELGHLAVIKLHHKPIRQIRIEALGAVIIIGCMDHKTEWHCALAGPVAGALFGLLLLRIWPECAVISLLLSVVNLLPLYPLDGGRILRSWAMSRFGVIRAERMISKVAVTVSCLLMLGACSCAVFLQMGLWPIFLSLALLWRADGRE